MPFVRFDSGKERQGKSKQTDQESDVPASFVLELDLDLLTVDRDTPIRSFTSLLSPFNPSTLPFARFTPSDPFPHSGFAHGPAMPFTAKSFKVLVPAHIHSQPTCALREFWTSNLDFLVPISIVYCILLVKQRWPRHS